MLQYMGTHQPPRKYTVPPNLNPTPSILPLCESCTSNVWTSGLFSALRAAPAEDPQFATSYQVSSSVLRDSVLRGCKWCISLANGINGRIFLDAIYEQWAKTESWLEETEGEETDGEETDGEETKGEESKGEETERKELGTEEKENDWSHVTTLDEDDEDNESAAGWDSYEDKDVLAMKYNIEVNLSFKRKDGGLFSFMVAHIEVLGQEDDEENPAQNLRGEKAVDLRYHVNLSGVDKLIAEIFPLTVTSTVLGDESNMKIVCDWLQESDRLSPSSVTGANSLTVPSRLIDVGSGELRIIETSSISFSESDCASGFAALSYVWGTNQTFVLLSTTANELMSGFDLEKLPQTIQDAVTVARKLEFRYLWVDALCIMQDSDTDKAIELPKMRQIYQKASITIVAAVSKTATEGFLHIPIETSYFIDPISIPYLLQGNKDVSSPDTSLILSYPAAYMRQKDPINDRAWTFQEWILPTRLISFSYRGIETIDRRNVPNPDGLTSGKDAQLPNLPWHGNFYTLDPDQDNLRQRWLSTRDEYSRRKLTYGGDKLVAIAAVAEEIGRSYRCRYLAGLWEKDLELDLQWARVDQPHSSQDVILRPRAKEYVAPSWSWASISGEIEDRASDVERKSGSEYLDFDIVSCKLVHAVPAFCYGAVKSGVLVVKGRVRSFFWQPETRQELVSCDGYLAVRGQTDPHPEMAVGEAWIDALEPELVGGCLVDCLAMSMVERIPGKEEIEGLVLFSADNERHRRVGYFKVVVKALYDDVEAMEVTII